MVSPMIDKRIILDKDYRARILKCIEIAFKAVKDPELTYEQKKVILDILYLGAREAVVKYGLIRTADGIRYILSKVDSGE